MNYRRNPSRVYDSQDTIDQTTQVMAVQERAAQFKQAHNQNASAKSQAAQTTLAIGGQINNLAQSRAGVTDLVKAAVGAVFPELGVAFSTQKILSIYSQLNPTDAAKVTTHISNIDTAIQQAVQNYKTSIQNLSSLVQNQSDIVDSYNQFRDVDAGDVTLPSLPVSTGPAPNIAQQAFTLAQVFDIDYLDPYVKRDIFENCQEILHAAYELSVPATVTVASTDASGNSTITEVPTATAPATVTPLTSISVAPSATVAVTPVSADSAPVGLAANGVLPAVPTAAPVTVTPVPALAPATANINVWGVAGVLGLIAYVALSKD